MRLDIPTDGIEQLIASLGFEGAKDMLKGRAVSLLMASIDDEMEKYAERREARQGNRIVGSPASANNQQRPPEPPPPIEDDPRYFTPRRRLQDLLCEAWFDEVSKDKKKYTTTWRKKLIDALMASEYRDEIANLWAQRDQRLQLKGHVMGALTRAGVFLKKKNTPIARIYYRTRVDTKNSDTLAKYMGDSKKKYYADWIIEYVTNPPVESQTSTIEKQ